MVRTSFPIIPSWLQFNESIFQIRPITIYQPNKNSYGRVRRGPSLFWANSVPLTFLMGSYKLSTMNRLIELELIWYIFLLNYHETGQDQLDRKKLSIKFYYLFKKNIIIYIYEIDNEFMIYNYKWNIETHITSLAAGNRVVKSPSMDYSSPCPSATRLAMGYLSILGPVVSIRPNR